MVLETDIHKRMEDNQPAVNKVLHSTRIAELLNVYIDVDRARAMAACIVQDMTAIKFGLHEAKFTPRDFWVQNGILPQAEYILPKNLFDINSERGSDALEGSGLTCGNLLRLGQAIEMGRKYLGEQWYLPFAQKLTGVEHLDCLNEFWWLKFWRAVNIVSHAPKESGNDPDFDWRLTIQDGLAQCIINLEVKRRTSSINSFFKRGNPSASTNDILKKFGKVEEGHANVAAITLYHQISNDNVHRLLNWFNRAEHLHGLLVWTEGNMGGVPLRKYFKESHKWAEHLVQEHAPEDLKVAFRAQGTLSEADQISDFLDNMS